MSLRTFLFAGFASSVLSGALAWADSFDSLEAHTAAGADLQSQGIGFTGSGERWEWSGTYSLSRALLDADSVLSHQATVGFENGKDRLSMGLSGGLSLTPEDSFLGVVAALTLGYEVASWLRVSGKAGPAAYMQAFDLAPRKLRRASGTVAVFQGMVGGAVALMPWDWISIRGGGTRYLYGPAVVTRLENLESTRAVRTGQARISSTLSGIAAWEVDTGLGVSFLEVWSFEGEVSWTEYVLDSTVGRLTSLELYRDFGKSWTVGLGAEQDWDAASGSRWAGLLDLEFRLN